MRKLLSEWKKFLFEEVEYQGILKTNLDGDSLTALEAIQAMLPEEGIRLSPDDFVISDLDYVSIYVDNDSQEMILSMDRNLAEDDLITGIVIPDENTYH